MLNGKSLTELAAELDKRQALKKDFVVPAPHIEMQESNGELTIGLQELEMGTAFSPTNHAHSQLSEFTGIPKRYYDRMRTEMPWLLEANVNTWLREARDKNRMVRTLGGDLRALLSDRYRRIENEEVAHAALEPLMEMAESNQLQVLSADVTDQKLYIQARFPRLEGEVKVNDPVQAGLIITNSEIGMGQMEVRPLIYRLVCSNGMVVPKDIDTAQLRRRHTGRRVEANGEDYSIYSDETLKADDHALRLKIRDTVRSMADPDKFQRVIEQMRQAAESERVGNPVKAVEELGKAFQLPETPRQNLLEKLIQNGDYSKWGMANAVTELAHGSKDYDSSVEYEELGGKVISLHQSEWKRIAEAV